MPMPVGGRAPQVTVQQKLFCERYWSNNGDLADAVLYAGYVGYPYPADRAKKGRQLLANKAIKAYLAYMRAAYRAELKTRQAEIDRQAARAAQGKPLSKQRIHKGDFEVPPAEDLAALRAAADAAVVAGFADVRPKDANVAGWPPGGRGDCWPASGETVADGPNGPNNGGEIGGYVPARGPNNGGEIGGFLGRPPAVEAGPGVGYVEVGTRHTTTRPLVPGAELLPPQATVLPPPTYVPPNVDLPAPAGLVATPDEIKAFLTSVMRGTHREYRDTRVRLRATELLMRNLGMLVELSATAQVEAKALSPAEREAEIKRLEEFLAKADAPPADAE